MSRGNSFLKNRPEIGGAGDEGGADVSRDPIFRSRSCRESLSIETAGPHTRPLTKLDRGSALPQALDSTSVSY